MIISTPTNHVYVQRPATTVPSSSLPPPSPSPSSSASARPSPSSSASACPPCRRRQPAPACLLVVSQRPPASSSSASAHPPLLSSSASACPLPAFVVSHLPVYVHYRPHCHPLIVTTASLIASQRLRLPIVVVSQRPACPPSSSSPASFVICQPAFLIVTGLPCRLPAFHSPHCHHARPPSSSSPASLVVCQLSAMKQKRHYGLSGSVRIQSGTPLMRSMKERIVRVNRSTQKSKEDAQRRCALISGVVFISVTDSPSCTDHYCHRDELRSARCRFGRRRVDAGYRRWGRSDDHSARRRGYVLQPCRRHRGGLR
jgi:hypothetical protein